MHFMLALISATVVFGFGCTAEVEPIEYGKDNCHWCQMRIMDPKFGSAVVTDKGRNYKFDSAECLLHYLTTSGQACQHTVVTNFESPGHYIISDEAWFLVSKNMPSPMGGYLNAFATQEAAQNFQAKEGGEIYDWNGIFAVYAK